MIFLSFAASHRIILLAVPLFIATLRWGYPDNSLAVQIVCTVFWLILLIGNARAAAFSLSKLIKPAIVSVAQIILGVTCGILLSCLLHANKPISSPEDIGKLILFTACASAFSWYLSGLILQYVICPLFILEQTDCTAPLMNYAAYWQRRTKYFFISFDDDPEQYAVNCILFQRVRNKVGVPFHYTKCRCLFDLYYIKKVYPAEKRTGLTSFWERQYQDGKAKRMPQMLAIICIGAVLTAGILFLWIFTAGL